MLARVNHLHSPAEAVVAMAVTMLLAVVKGSWKFGTTTVVWCGQFKRCKRRALGIGRYSRHRGCCFQGKGVYKLHVVLGRAVFDIFRLPRSIINYLYYVWLYFGPQELRLIKGL